MSPWLKYVDDNLFVKYRGIQIYSLEDPVNPVLSGYYDTPNSAYDLAIDGNRVVVADMTDIGVYDVSRAQGAWYLELSSENIDFPDTPIDSLSRSQLRISNLSNINRSIDSIVVDGAVFQCSPDSALSIGGGESINFEITFRPLADTTYFGSIDLWSNGSMIEVALTGQGVIPDEVDQHDDIWPIGVELSAFPIPFNNATTISYALPTELEVKISIYDLSGREVAVIRDGGHKGGDYSAIWQAENLPSGIYICRLKAGNISRSVKMTLLK
jgi:hypothetical protein